MVEITFSFPRFSQKDSFEDLSPEIGETKDRVREMHVAAEGV